jgi:two-component system chemotaxis sensor kinase CheA
VDDLHDIVKDFLVESYENLDQLDRDLVQLEQDPDSAKVLGSIFRTIHTIKGACGFLGFSKLESVAHAGENLLSKVRDREVEFWPDRSSGLFRLVDAIREILRNIESNGVEGEQDYTQLLQSVALLQSARDPSASSTGVPGYFKPVTESQNASKRAVRVDVELLDRLLHGVTELVVARKQIEQCARLLGDIGLFGASQKLDAITSELREAVAETQLQPIGNVWSKYPRFVRDLALKCGKQVGIEMVGRETKVDRLIAEAIKDPLLHLVRNAVGHGIEPPGERLVAGKPATGRLVLAAARNNTHVEIEIRDDGRGIDLQRVRCKAVERGILTAERADEISDHEAARMIFLPGFSTADTVTHLSGRGVGMDVVKTNIERIGGVVGIESRLGQGTTVRLSIPATCDGPDGQEHQACHCACSQVVGTGVVRSSGRTENAAFNG